jgi:prephenate dehydratase
MLDVTNILNSRDNKPKSLLYARLILASKSINLTNINLTNDKNLSRISRTA